MDDIRDRLSVGQHGDGWAIWLWEEYDSRVIGYFLREDEAWGVVSLILEYVELHGYDDSDACYAAMREYREVIMGEWGHRAAEQAQPDAGELARQDHRWAMAVA